jgi:hypothetical protein
MMAASLVIAGVLPIAGCGGAGTPGAQSVDFPLGAGLGQFTVEAELPIARRGTGEFNTGGFTVGTGEIVIGIDGITVTPDENTGDKAAVRQQGELTLGITVWLAGVDLLETVCDVGEQYGPYTVTLDADYTPTAIDPPTITLTQATIDLLNTGEFSVCIGVLSPVNGTVTIESFTFNLSS